MTCDYCKKPVLYSMDFGHDDGSWTPIKTCDDHFALGQSKQKTLAWAEDFRARCRLFGTGDNRVHLTSDL